MNGVIGGLAGIVLLFGSCGAAFAATPLYHLTGLGTLAGGNAFVSSYAGGINNDGQVVGYSRLIASQDYDHAFLYQNGSMQDLGTLGNASYPYSINDSGQIAGGYHYSANKAQDPAASDPMK